MSSIQTENINNTFFEGYYKEIWRSLIPEALTKAEVDYLIQEGKLQTGNKVLDLMCGYGRHALALARKGMEVMAVDNLADYISEINDAAQKENLPVKTLCTDIMQFRADEKYDLVICMGNSLSILNKDDTLKLFSAISSCLNQGHKFIFNTWMIAEIAIKQFKDKSWSYIGDLKHLSDSKYLFGPTRIETETTIITPNGSTEIKNAIDYVYSLNETEAMLKQSGFAVKEIWSIPGKKKFTFGEPRVYIVAEKI
jgi:cyclopropane fatty-acyl-phospholipid synthase-like methyltransferase